MIKRNLIFMVCAAGLLASCTRNADLDESGVIRLGAQALTTRAVVNDAAGLVAVGDNVGIYGVETANTSAATPIAPAEWVANPTMKNVRTTAIDLSGNISWSGTYSYPVNDRCVKFMAYHPYADGNNGNTLVMTPGETPKYNFKITGDEDLMVAVPIIGSRATPPASALALNHKLTQLNFQIVDASGDYDGVKITKMSFNDVNTTGTLDLETGDITNWGTPVSMDYGITYPLTISAGANIGAAQTLSKEVMLQAGLASFSIKLETDAGNFPNVVIRPISGDTEFVAGKAYMITLYFQNSTVITARATVTPWILGGYGEGIIE